MHIVLEDDNIDINEISDRYIVLDLDKFDVAGEIKQSYCILDASAIPLGEMPEIQHWTKNHNKIIENYHKRNWNFVTEMCDHIRNRWGGELVTFYDDIKERAEKYSKRTDLGEEWTGVIKRF